MGIRGLRSFLNKNCPSTLRPKDIVMMASTYRRKASKVATIVVDAPTCCFGLFEKMDMRCGGQFTEFKEIVQQFVDAFRQKNIKLVFFFDGLVRDQSLSRWYTKRTKDVKSMQIIMNEIKMGSYEQSETLTLHWVIIFFRLTLKALYKDDPLVEVYTAMENTRTLIIAEYATNNDCLAILSDDTIFIIFDTVPVMSCRKLNISNMTTLISNRNDICRELHFNKDHLKILASLTDYDDYDEDFFTFYNILKFAPNEQRNLYRPARRSVPTWRNDPNWRPGAPFPKLIKYINDFGDSSYQSIVDAIAEKLTTHCTQSLANFFRDNLRNFESEQRNTSYYKPNVEDEYAPEFTNYEAVVNYFTKKVTTSDMFTMALEVMTNGRVIIWNTPLQDKHDTSIVGHVELFRPIRQKLYEFIVLSPEIERRVISEAWLTLDCNSEEEFVDSISVPNNELSLTMLWSQLPENDARVNCLLQCFGFAPTDVKESFLSIPTKFQPLAIILRYMLKHPEMNLSEWEVSSFIAQAITSSTDNQEIFESLDPRACHLAGLFIDGIIMFLNVALCCCLDLQSYMPWNYFDGKKLHYFYQKMKLGTTASQLLSKNEEDMELLMEQLLAFIEK